MEGERGRGGESEIGRAEGAAAGGLRHPGPGWRAEGRPRGPSRPRRGAGGVREGVRGSEAKREGRAEKEPGKEEVAGRGA